MSENNEVRLTSPVPQPKKQEMFDFPEAMRRIINGEKVTRLEWANTDYCFLDSTWLSINRNGLDHAWQVSDGDMLGTDWMVVVKGN